MPQTTMRILFHQQAEVILKKQYTVYKKNV